MRVGANGCRNGVELWRRLKPQGFDGFLRVVGERALLTAFLDAPHDR
jgi:hypothetical protein